MKKVWTCILVLCACLAIGAAVTLGGSASQTAQADTTNTVITMQLGSPNMTVNGTVRPIDGEGTAPITVNGRTLLPLRAIAEALGLEVEWNGATQTITLHSIDAEQRSQTEQSEQPTNESKVLVAYFSATGSTKTVAGYIAEELSADTFAIIPAQPYVADDLNWQAAGSRVNREHEDESLRAVELVSATVENWDAYDTVFVGYPIWWGIAAWPINGFVQANDFDGKTVIPFCTSTSSSLGESARLLAESASGGDWQEGRRFSSSVAQSEVQNWVRSLNVND